ncbi:NAD(P)H-dependent oxidoreductase [Herbaspirillum sp. LeCh32-8]|uniref:NADPH-dependent FMN reductase n=1 Tax=Herbaspirillum sp. LeCh32-8 TaxID=2821356 RepID=UPI001AEAB23B|nr:NADPH-dependent FMN reductase [Herbaspirillum sp. LeCh32-8]MBP0597994.1 NAD(P)H-dependent oxidoreductase [Herbaspirillum sp. LeCh32-8]
MHILAISGSARKASTNTALLRAMQALAPAGMTLSVFDRIDSLPVFSPDAEGEATPAQVLALLAQLAAADGVIISSPEYVRAIPGGMKNAIDWMVSRDEIIGKPMALVHASHRGDDMLASLRLVLSTVSTRFFAEHFLRIGVVGKSPQEVQEQMRAPHCAQQVTAFLQGFAQAIRRDGQAL